MRALLPTLLLLSTVTILAQRAWYEFYDDAKEAIVKQQWLQAEKLLLQSKAIAAKQGIRPGRAVLRYGSDRRPYFPDYYLAIVYSNIKRDKEAIDLFAAAEAQGLPKQDREFREFDKLLADTRATVARVAENNVGRGGEPGRGDPGRGDPARGGDPPPDPKAADRKQFMGLTNTANQQLKQGNFGEARRAAQSARDLNFDNPTADRLLGDITAAENKAIEDKRIADANAEAAKLKERQTTINNLAGQVDAALKGRDLAKAKTALNNLVAAAPDDARVVDFRNGITSLERAIAMTAAERSAMQAFFAGQFQNALGILNKAGQSAPLSPRAYFYRACSLAALALQAKTPDAGTLNRARQEFKQALPGRDQFVNDRQYISPRILQAIGAS